MVTAAKVYRQSASRDQSNAPFAPIFTAQDWYLLCNTQIIDRPRPFRPSSERRCLAVGMIEQMAGEMLISNTCSRNGEQGLCAINPAWNSSFVSGHCLAILLSGPFHNVFSGDLDSTILNCFAMVHTASHVLAAIRDAAGCIVEVAQCAVALQTTPQAMCDVGFCISAKRLSPHQDVERGF